MEQQVGGETSRGVLTEIDIAQVAQVVAETAEQMGVRASQDPLVSLAGLVALICAISILTVASLTNVANSGKAAFARSVDPVTKVETFVKKDDVAQKLRDTIRWFLWACQIVYIIVVSLMLAFLLFYLDTRIESSVFEPIVQRFDNFLQSNGLKLRLAQFLLSLLIMYSVYVVVSSILIQKRSVTPVKTGKNPKKSRVG